MQRSELDLSGTWQSTYEYGEGLQGRHTIKLRQDGQQVTGTNLPHPSGSELELELFVRKDSTLEGFWTERTSPTGTYHGNVFHGVLHLILNDKGNKAKGNWSGHNRDYSAVNSGEWMLEKQEK